MPIQGLTDQLERKMPRLAQVRKGAPKTGKKPGKDLTYFRFVCQDPDIDRRFHEVYGTEPRLINVRLPFDTLEQNFPTWNEEWGAGSLKHRCDSKTMILWQDEEGLYRTQPEPCPYADLEKGDPARKCKQTGLLRVFIDALGEWGYVDVVTGGKWDCIGLTENVKEIEHMAALASSMTGRPIGVQGIPCQLKRAPRMTSCPNFSGDGARQRQEKWMLYLYVHPDYLKSLMEEMSRHSLPVVDLPQLDAPTPELEVDYYVGNGDDVEQVEAEIMPDEEPEASPNGDVPEEARTGPKLLKYANAHVQVPFDNVVTLRSELAAAGLEGKTWPAYSRKPDWWRQAFDLTFEIAESKEYTEAA